MRSLLVSRPMADMDNNIIPHAVFSQFHYYYYNTYNVCIQIDVETQKKKIKRNLYKEENLILPPNLLKFIDYIIIYYYGVLENLYLKTNHRFLNNLMHFNCLNVPSRINKLSFCYICIIKSNYIYHFWS